MIHAHVKDFCLLYVPAVLFTMLYKVFLTVEYSIKSLNAVFQQKTIK